MAKMYPETLDGAQVQSPAERFLFNRFEEQLSDHFTVVHSVAWLSIPREGAPPMDGEADFIIMHAKMGVLIIEVKGGQIGFDEATGWFSVRRDASQVSIKDPFQQVRGSKHALRRKIKSLPNWQGALPTMGHAVAFPEGVVDLTDLAPDINREIILLHSDLEDLESWVRKCLKFYAGDGFVAPGDAGLEILRRFLRKSWMMREPRLGEQVGPGKTAIHRYTEEQFQLLDWISGRKRAAIRGCAGSGKTVLAVEKVHRLADEGFKTLFTCFNRSLADHLRYETRKHPNLTVLNFHSLCAKYASDTGFDASPNWDPSSKDFYSAIMPEALAFAAESKDEGYLFDAIVVDEAQDFASTWWVALEMLLQNPEQGVFYVFFDDNQKVYPREIEIPINEPAFTLTTNCRNTRQIHEFVQRFYTSDETVHPARLDGPEIRQHLFNGAIGALREALTEILSRLVFEEAIAPSELVLLSPLGHQKDPLVGMPSAGAFRFVESASSQPRDIYSETIRRFKGLESSVVILLLEPPELVTDELLYVGGSRATYHLEIIMREGSDWKFEVVKQEPGR